MDQKKFVENAIKTESVPTSINLGPQATFAAIGFMVAAADLMNQVKRQIYYGKAADVGKMQVALENAMGCAEFLVTQAQNDKLLDQNDLTDTLTKKGVQEQEIGAMNKHFTDCRDRLNVRLLHATLGIFTESGEMAEAIKRGGLFGAMDMVNFGEEVGDCLYYTAIASDEISVPLEQIMQANNDKLRKRYPSKFSADHAVNRDVAAERKILEDGLSA